MTRKLVGRKGSWLLSLSIFFALFLTLAFPHVVSAQFGGFDPAGQIANMYSSNNWLGQAQAWGKQIYVFLLVFELIALTISTLLFRENVGEFLSSVGLKILIGSVFFWFIANAGVAGVPGQVLATFTQFGQKLGGNGNPTTLAAEGLVAAGGYFAAGVVAKDADAVKAATIEPTIPPGNCASYLGTGFCYKMPSETVLHTHDFFELVVNALALMIAMALAAIYLQFALITIETYLVMGAGTLFIGFAGSRFTMPFSQGYFSYMINVGVKMMTLYIVLGMEEPLLKNVLLSSVATLAIAAATPDFTGVLYPLALATAAYGALSVVIGAALVTLIPGFASSFLTGQSTVSGTAALQQTMSSVAGSAQMMAQFSAAAQQNKLASADRTAESKLASGQAQQGASQQNLSQQMAPPSTGQDPFAPAAPASGANNGATADPMRMSAPGVPGLATGPAAAPALANNGATADPMRMSAPPAPSTPSLPNGAPAGLSAQSNNGAMSDLLRMSATGNGDGPSTYDASTPRGPQGQPLDSGSSSPKPNGRGLQDLSREELMTANSAELREAARNTSAEDLQNADLRDLAANPNASAVDDVLSRRVGDEERSAALSEGYGLSGLAQAAPRDVGQPTAVQVRIGNPDKL